MLLGAQMKVSVSVHANRGNSPDPLVMEISNQSDRMYCCPWDGLLSVFVAKGRGARFYLLHGPNQDDALGRNLELVVKVITYLDEQDEVVCATNIPIKKGDLVAVAFADQSGLDGALSARFEITASTIASAEA
jgi:hypothetical protein